MKQKIQRNGNAAVIAQQINTGHQFSIRYQGILKVPGNAGHMMSFNSKILAGIFFKMSKQLKHNLRFAFCSRLIQGYNYDVYMSDFYQGQINLGCIAKLQIMPRG